MSKPRRDKEYLGDVQEAVQRIISYTSGLSYEQFLKDARTQDAVIRNLQIIGEASKKLSIRLKQTFPKIPWKEMSGIRDKIVHDYFGINYDIVWNVSKHELPVLLNEIESIQKEGE
jgi:uncharacterized protein with HEPN domain